MTGETKPGEAVADRWRETFEKNRKETDLSLTRLEVRAEQRSSDFEENSAVIHMEANKRIAEREGSIPAPARGIRVVLTAVDSWQKVAALLILVVGLLAGYWLKSR